MDPGECFLQGKGFYGDTSKARNEVILSDSWKEIADHFLGILSSEEYVLIVFFSMFNLINWL